MTELLLPHADEKLKGIYAFFDRNKTIFTLIAIFGALAGFLYSFDKTSTDENLVFGILFLVFLMCLLLILIIYDVAATAIELLNEERNFVITFQIFFIGTFTVFLLMFYDSLIEYLYSKFPGLLIWLGIAVFLYFMLAISTWSTTFIVNRIGDSKRSLLLITILYSIAVAFLIVIEYLSLQKFSPIAPSIVESSTAQFVFTIGILLIYCVNSTFFFAGTLIKQISNVNASVKKN
jgi:hypothetical protein